MSIIKEGYQIKMIFGKRKQDKIRKIKARFERRQEGMKRHKQDIINKSMGEKQNESI